VEYSQVSLGFQLSCGIRRADSVGECWGRNFATTAGLGEQPVTTLSVGVNHVCAVAAEGGFVGCWGLEDELAKLSPEFWEFGVGLVLVLTVLFARRGLLGLLEDISRRFGRSRAR
jgi:hypothetical protein